MVPGAALARAIQHPVAAQPAQHLHWQVSEQERQPGHVVADVEDDQDGRIARTPLPGFDQPGDAVTSSATIRRWFGGGPVGEPAASGPW